MLRYQAVAVSKYSCTLECLAYESHRLVKYPGYAAYYGRRLPTTAEWHRAVGNLFAADVVIMPDGVKRKPWEAFEEVGFRCVRPVKDAPADKKQAGDASPGENSPAK